MPARTMSLLSFLLFHLVALPLLLAPSAWAYPRVAEPLFGLRQLREHVVSDDGRRMTMDFVHEDAEAGENGRRVEVSYDLEMAPGLRAHNTDEEEHLLEVHGPEAGQVRLVFASGTAAAAFDASVGEGDVIHGHYQEKPGEAADILPYHARVLGKTFGEGNGEGSVSAASQGSHVLLLTVDTPGLTELFINAKAKVVVRLAPQDYRILRNNASMAATEYGQEDPKELEEKDGDAWLEGLREEWERGFGKDKEGKDDSTIVRRRRRQQRRQRQQRQRGLTPVRRELRKSDFLQKGLVFIKNMFRTVQRLLNGAVDVLEVITTGDIGPYNKTDTVEVFGFNYDESNGEGVCSFKVEEALELPSAIMPFSGECRDCYAYSHLQLRFEIDVRNYKMKRLVTMIEGNIDFNIALDELKVASKGYVGERVSTFMALVGPAVPIHLGPVVALTVEITVPVELGVELDTASTATFAVDIASRAFIKAGMHWSTYAQPMRQLITEVAYRFGGPGVWATHLGADEGSLRFYLLPAIQFHLSLGSGNLKALMGGPNLGMRAYAQGVGTRNGTSIDTMKDCGVEGTLGLNMSLAVGKEDLLAGAGRKSPEGIYSRIFPMGTHTVPNRSLRRVTADEPVNFQSASIDTDDHGDRGRGLAPVGFDDWVKVGLTYQGTLRRLKNYCDDDDGSEVFIPSFLQASAVVLGFNAAPSNGGILFLAMAFSYGKDTVSEQQSGVGGAFAALNQQMYALSIYDFFSACTSVNTLFTPSTSLETTYPGISYTASTTNESVVLPRLYGGVCDSGTKIILTATDGCFRIDLDRVNRGGDFIQASSSSAVRRELGHDQRFGRVLAEVCSATSEKAKPSGIALLSASAAATTNGPSSAPTRSPSLRPTTLPSLSPTLRPTMRPSASPSLSPSALPTRAPSTRPSASPSLSPSARPSPWPTQDPSSSPSLSPSTSPSRSPSTPPSASSSLLHSALSSPWPTQEPSTSPSLAPIADPHQWPSSQPSAFPFSLHSALPSPWPTPEPSASPSLSPTTFPSRGPSSRPSASPSSSPSTRPSPWPTQEPSASPLSPVTDPNERPSSQPSESPSSLHSALSSPWPTQKPPASPSSPVTATSGGVSNTLTKAPVTIPPTVLDSKTEDYPTEGPADVTVTSGEPAVDMAGDIGSSVPDTRSSGGLAGPEPAAKATPFVPVDPPRTSPPTTAPPRSHKDSVFDNDDPNFYFDGDEKEAADYVLIDENRGTDDIFPNASPNDESHSGQLRGSKPPALPAIILWVTIMILAICIASGVW